MSRKEREKTVQLSVFHAAKRESQACRLYYIGCTRKATTRAILDCLSTWICFEEPGMRNRVE